MQQFIYQLEELQNTRKGLKVPSVKHNIGGVCGAGGGACYSHGVRHLGGGYLGGGWLRWVFLGSAREQKQKSSFN